ncbi:MAG: hypothetical protein IKZ88_01470 [Neisseriaceae bacterium]|nr:hypothetical protein [Neisseriaceae bacterium]
MKKIIISALIGALFGGTVVFTATQPNFFQQNQMIENTKGLSETVQDTPKVVENTKNNDDDMDANIYNSHYSNYLTLCFDKGDGTTGAIAGCYENTTQLAENELAYLFFLTAQENEDIEEKFNQWKKEREKKCEGYIQISQSTCLADFTVAKISEMYQ